jgi:regulation of enolase protein 1 (concanavalin A-like superfamily)
MIISIYISNINYGVILLNNLQTEQMKTISFGVYAASPWDGPFEAFFTEMKIEKHEKT